MSPYYEADGITIYHGDCREVLPTVPAGDVVVTDPPYGDTSLEWDRRVAGWCDLVRAPQLWCFGSLRYLFAVHPALLALGWSYAQEVVWEKHNGSGFANDRFKRVHEFAAHWYRGAWAELYRDTPTTPDATKRTVRRKASPAHTGGIAESRFESHDGGPRLMRSVIYCRSEHGRAHHPTQKPVGIVAPLVTYSCPVGGLVVDPFMGSGSTLVAARDSGRRAVGIEIEERYCEIAAQRLSQQALALSAELATLRGEG